MEHLLGAIGGALFVWGYIWSARRLGWESWTYAAALLALPLFYMGFALLAPENQMALLRQEALYGLPFFIGGVVLLMWRAPASLYVVAGLWGLHGFYDYGHNLFFENPGVFGFYPALCTVVDVTLCIYLITLANKQKAEAAAPA